MCRDYSDVDDRDFPARAKILDENAAERLLDVMGSRYYDDAESLTNLVENVDDVGDERLSRVVDTFEWFGWTRVRTTNNGVELTDAGRAAYDADEDDEPAPDVTGPWWLEGDDPPETDADPTEVLQHGDD